MEERNTKTEGEPPLPDSETGFLSDSAQHGESMKCSRSALSFDPDFDEIIEDYAQQLISLIDCERDLASFELGLSLTNPVSRRVNEISRERLANRERIEMLFSELSKKMWQGQLPPTTIAIVEQRYREITNKLLNEELRDEQWASYFSAFQLSIDILNAKSGFRY